jgi:hypothetical protein
MSFYREFSAKVGQKIVFNPERSYADTRIASWLLVTVWTLDDSSRQSESWERQVVDRGAWDREMSINSKFIMQK